MMKRFMRILARHEGGAAVIELALISPILALTIVGIVDISNAFSRKLALEQGAQRAIEKIMQTTEDDTVEGTLKTEAVCQVNGMNADKTCKTTPISAANVTVTWMLECRNSSGAITGSQTSTDADAFDLLSCTAVDRPSRYIKVAVTDKYTPMFPIHFGAINSGDKKYHLSATAGMRTQ